MTTLTPIAQAFDTDLLVTAIKSFGYEESSSYEANVFIYPYCYILEEGGIRRVIQFGVRGSGMNVSYAVFTLKNGNRTFINQHITSQKKMESFIRIISSELPALEIPINSDAA